MALLSFDFEHFVSKLKMAFAQKNHTHDDRYYTESEINTKLNGKANTTHSHVTTDLSEPNYVRGSQPITMQAKVDYLRANKLIFLPAEQIIIEKTTDGGETWVDAGYSDAVKRSLFDETRKYSIALPLLNGVKSLNCGIRITITAMRYNVPENTPEVDKYQYWNATYVKSTERYCSLSDMYLWINTNRDSMGVKIEGATGAASNTWKTVFNNANFLATGWDGTDYVKLTGNVFGGGTSQTTNSYWNYRITFMTRGTTASNGETLATTYTTSPQTIMQIACYGLDCWRPANSMMKFDHIYTWDADQNATFAANVTATQFNGNLNGKATSASSADSVAWANVSGKPSFFSGNYNDLSNKPTIPSAVTELTVNGWGFTKNTGTVKSINDVQPDANGNVALSISGLTKLDFTTASNWVSGGIGYKLTLNHNDAKKVEVYHILSSGKSEPVIVGLEIQSNNITIESFEKFNGYVVIS